MTNILNGSCIGGVDMETLCKQCIPLLELTGAFIVGELGQVDASRIEEKSLNSLVSYVDKNAEERLVTGLSLLLPGATFLTEEETVVQQEESFWRWIIDPLDGTTNFLHGLPSFAISVALTHQDEVVLGLVYEVNRKELFYAWKKGGAFCNGKRIGVSRSHKLRDALVATGFPYSKFELLPMQLSAVEYFQRNTRGIRRWGAASVDLCFVACGRFDIYFEYALNPWDVAAGILILEEAGGKASDFTGDVGDYSGREVLVTNGYLHEQALGILRRVFYA